MPYTPKERAAILAAWEGLEEIAGRHAGVLAEAVRLERRAAGSPGRPWPIVAARANLIHTVSGDRFREVADLEGLRTAHLIAVSLRVGLERDPRFAAWRDGPAAACNAARAEEHKRTIGAACRVIAEQE